MLQQTQAGRVGPYFEQFVERWPTPEALAGAEVADVLRLWDGLGYPRRAVNLHRAAQVLVERHGGEVPRGEADLLALPGVGHYTASALRAFAFGEHAGALDTNYGRIVARWAGRPLKLAEAKQAADSVVPADQAWEWNHAMMDLGALVCTRRKPKCAKCPVRDWCGWQNSGLGATSAGGRDTGTPSAGGAFAAGPDPADGSAMVGRASKPFSGSDRQLRGILMKALVAGPVAERDAASVMGLATARDAERAARLVDDLVADGLVSREDDQLRLG